MCLNEGRGMAVVDPVKVNFILSTLKDMEYGSVIITVHDGNITQIDKAEKTQFRQKNLYQKNRNNEGVYKKYQYLLLFRFNNADQSY